VDKKANAQHSVCCYAGGRKSNLQLNNYQIVSGRRNSFEHLLLTSSAAILFGFSSGLDVIKSQHSSKPDALAVIF
jgi:hypothetical protein